MIELISSHFPPASPAPIRGICTVAPTSCATLATRWAFTDGPIAYGRNTAMWTNIVLANQIGNPKLLSNWDKLNLAQGKRNWLVAAMPSTIVAFRFGPFTGECHDKSTTPSAYIIAHMDDNAWAAPVWIGGITNDILDRHASLLLHGCNQR